MRPSRRLVGREPLAGDILIDAALLGKLLDVKPAEVPTLMRAHAITSFCERGVDAHQGQFRLSFFYRNGPVAEVVGIGLA